MSDKDAEIILWIDYMQSTQYVQCVMALKN